MGRPGARPDGSFVYLASQSPRRRELLAQIGVRHELLLAGPEEDAESLEAEIAGELPSVYVERVTRAKLAAARRRLAVRALPEAPILCADTTVALGRRVLGKPGDAEDAARTLALLAGKTHRVISAVAVASGRRSRLLASVSRVRFASLTAVQIDAYVAKRIAKESLKAAPAADDAEFLRRVWLDVCGGAPDPNETIAFLADRDPDKRRKKLDDLLAKPDMARNWAEFWTDVMEGEATTKKREDQLKLDFRTWFEGQLKQNVPFDEPALTN